MQNVFSLVDRTSGPGVYSHHGLAGVLFLPAGGTFAGMPKKTERPDVIAVTQPLGVTPACAGWPRRDAASGPSVTGSFADTC